MKTKTFFAFALAFLSLGLGTFAGIKNSPAVVTHAEELPECTITSASIRAGSDNTGGGVGPTVQIYANTTGKVTTVRQYVATGIKVYDKTATQFVDVAVNACVYVAGERFVVDLPDYATMDLDHVYSFYFPKGTVIANSAKISADFAFEAQLVKNASEVYSWTKFYCASEGANPTYTTQVETVPSMLSACGGTAEAFAKINLSVNDNEGLTTHVYAGGLSNFKPLQYNYMFKMLIQRADGEEYLPSLYFIRFGGAFYFNEGCSFRIPLDPPYETNAAFYSVKFMEGCQFPSYITANGGESRVLVVADEVGYISENPAANNSSFAPIKENGTMGDCIFYGFPGDWNSKLIDSNTNEITLLEMTVEGGQFSDGKSTTYNEALSMGDYATINGVPFKNIPGAKINFSNGVRYVAIRIPVAYAVASNGYSALTVEIKSGAAFQDHFLPHILLVEEDGVFVCKAASCAEVNMAVASQKVELSTGNRLTIYLSDPDELTSNGDYGRPTVKIKNLATSEVTTQQYIMYKTHRMLIDGFINCGNTSVATYKVTFEAGSKYKIRSYVDVMVKEEYSFYLSVNGESVYAINETDKAAIDAYCADSLHMSDYDAELTGTGDGSCTTYYGAAKTAFAALTDVEKAVFQESTMYVNELARLQAWATANGEVLNNGSFNTINSRNTITGVSSDALMIIIPIIAASLLALLFVYKKKMGK